MVFIVILEPLVKLRQYSFCVGSIRDINIIPFKGFDESFGDAVELRAPDGGKTADETHILRKSSRFCSGVATATIPPYVEVWQ